MTAPFRLCILRPGKLNMETIRSFIAIELPATIQVELGRVIKQLGPATRAVRWVPAQNIHLTLQFLGDVEASAVANLQATLKQEAKLRRPFEIHVGQSGAFPNLRRPRVIWIGVQAPPELADLQRGIARALAPLGYPPEDRPFSPHLTLGRVSQHAAPEEIGKLANLLAKTTVGELGICSVHAVQLFRSDLRPTGSIYSRLFEAPFAP